MSRQYPDAPAVAPAEGCERLACCIPHCGRTFRNGKAGAPWSPGSVVICGKHWRLIPKDKRARYTKLRRLYENKRGTLQGELADRVARLLDQEWPKLEKIAIERSAGI